MDQNYQITNNMIREQFLEYKQANPESFTHKLNLSWSNWGFGLEKLADSAKRLNASGIKWIELHGNHYGPDLGYDPKETARILEDFQLGVAGTCGMFSADNDLSSNRGIQRQAAIDYIKRELEFTSQVGGSYMLVVPGAVGRPDAYDGSEFQRSVETLRSIAGLFIKFDIRCAIEPIRSAEVSFIHTVADAKEYIKAVDHPGVSHINGDVFHMQTEEKHISSAILDAGDMLTNLHMADSNRRALGEGSLDLDMIIMSLYLINYNQPGCFVTPEPLGPGGNPYPAMNEIPNQKVLDQLVKQTAAYFRERENYLLAM